jgi:hyperosmotically inducible periplasmic protein
MRIAKKLAFICSLLMAAGCTEYQQRQASYTPEPARGGQIISSTPVVNEADRALESSLRDQLSRYGDLASSAPNVQITARNGTVTLAGTVPNERERQMVEAMVKNTAGVTTVNDKLQVAYSPTGVYNGPTRVYSTPATAQPQPDVITSPTPTVTGDILNLRVQGVTEGDRVLGQRIVDSLRTDTVLPTLAPAVNINIAEGKVTLRGMVQSEQQRRAIIASVQRVPGVTAVYDELRLR